MVHIPYETVVVKLVSASGKSRDEIDALINQKLSEFSGLISKEGAAHIVANELEISITDAASGPYKIKEVKSGMKNATFIGKVLAKYNLSKFVRNDKEGKVASILFGDETGSIRVTFWHDETSIYERINENEIIMLTNMSGRENRNQLELHATSKTELTKNPQTNKQAELELLAGRKNVSVTFEQTPASEPQMQPVRDVIRKKISEISENDPVVEVLGVIVQVFKPMGYVVDKSTGKKIRLEPGSPFDALHHEMRYVMNIVVDDGFETMRVVFFGNDCNKLVGNTQLDVIKDDELVFSRVRTQLLGLMIKVVGRVSKNHLYERIELINRSFELSPLPEHELVRLNKVA